MDVLLMQLKVVIRYCMKLNTAKCERYVLFIFREVLGRVKSIVIANQWLINKYFYVVLHKNDSSEVT